MFAGSFDLNCEEKVLRRVAVVVIVVVAARKREREREEFDSAAVCLRSEKRREEKCDTSSSFFSIDWISSECQWTKRQRSVFFRIESNQCKSRWHPQQRQMSSFYSFLLVVVFIGTSWRETDRDLCPDVFAFSSVRSKESPRERKANARTEMSLQIFLSFLFDQKTLREDRRRSSSSSLISTSADENFTRETRNTDLFSKWWVPRVSFVSQEKEEFFLGIRRAMDMTTSSSSINGEFLLVSTENSTICAGKEAESARRSSSFFPS